MSGPAAAELLEAGMLEAALGEARAGLAEGGIPIGAALFADDGTLLGSGHNLQTTPRDHPPRLA